MVETVVKFEKKKKREFIGFRHFFLSNFLFPFLGAYLPGLGPGWQDASAPWRGPRDDRSLYHRTFLFPMAKSG